MSIPCHILVSFIDLDIVSRLNVGCCAYAICVFVCVCPCPEYVPGAPGPPFECVMTSSVLTAQEAGVSSRHYLDSL